jgi:hypothetical protein
MGILGWNLQALDMKQRMKMFTVVGFWTDTDQRYCSTVESTSAQAAELQCLAEHPALAVCCVLAGRQVPLDADLAVARGLADALDA